MKKLRRSGFLRNPLRSKGRNKRQLHKLKLRDVELKLQKLNPESLGLSYRVHP